MPYSFYVSDVEILESLRKAIAESKADTEAAIQIVYQPQAVFRVRPVTRCTGSLAGHSAPVIVMQFSPDGTQLVSGAGDSTVRFWDLDTSTPMFECKGRRVFTDQFSSSHRPQAVGDVRSLGARHVTSGNWRCASLCPYLHAPVHPVISLANFGLVFLRL